MEIKKSHWITDGDSMSLSVPFVKVDKKRRIVSGFATLDNVDKHGDIVDTQASMNAFSRFRGNIREMHQPIAVGKIVSFRQESFYDKETKKSYTGVFVDVYVSKGAEDTWEKVLDGTLSGFSIGGSINKSDTETDRDGYEGPVRVIKDYDLIELSLVDNPANQLANVFSIQKADIGFKVTGMATEIKTLNVFFCDSDGIAVSSEDDARDCTICDSAMNNIGWIEEASDTKTEDISEIVDSYVNKNTVSEGGINVAEELNNEAVEEAVEVEEVVEVEAPELPEEPAALEDGIEKSADVEEAVEEVAEEVAEEAVESEIEKMLNNIKSFITEAVEKSGDKTPSVDDIMGDLMRQINETKSDMVEKYSNIDKAVQDIQKSMKLLVERMDSYEAATAVKKSSDMETQSVENKKTKESIWKGHFLSVSDLS